MRVRGDHWPLRLVGSLFGLGSCGIGLFGVFGGSIAPPAERALGVEFGITAIVIGLVALIGSLITPDIRGLWYCSPKRWKMFRDR